jgi:hypothetical protein
VYAELVRASCFLATSILVAATGCENRATDQSAGPATSASTHPEPTLHSRYQTTWGELGWQERRFDTITYTNEGQTIFMRCALRNSPVTHCRWSREVKGAPGTWDRGKAKLTVQPDRSLVGTWGDGDSDSDGGRFEMKPLPRK